MFFGCGSEEGRKMKEGIRWTYTSSSSTTAAHAENQRRAAHAVRAGQTQHAGTTQASRIHASSCCMIHVLSRCPHKLHLYPPIFGKLYSTLKGIYFFILLCLFSSFFSCPLPVLIFSSDLLFYSTLQSLTPYA